MEKGFKTLELIGDLDDKYIYEASRPWKKQHRFFHIQRSWKTVAAGVILLIMVGGTLRYQEEVKAAFIIKRLPLRYTYDNNYFKDPYQGIPKGGYTRIVKKLLEGVQVCLNTDFFANREELTAQADKVLFTGMIDEFYDYCYGELEYRSLKFETEVLDMGNYQGNAVVNYTDYEVPYTRIIEHKHFEFGTQPKTVITREYPAAWEKGKEPYYPVNDPKNSELFDKYERRALEEKNVIFGGRLGMYRYMDMDQVIEEALSLAETELTYEEP
mgnify:CR=1 FL=1